MAEMSISTALILILMSPALLTLAILYRIDLTFLFNFIEALSYSMQVLILRCFGYRLNFPKLENGVVVVLGASTVIGSEVCVELVQKGYHVIAGVRKLAGILIVIRCP